MDMKIALIDDDIDFIEYFKKCLYASWKEDLYIDTYSNVTDQLLMCDYDIVFLDVLLEEKESFSFGKKIKETNNKTTLVYISNYDHFVYESYRQDVFFFIRKSTLQKDLIDFFDKYKTIKKRISESITIKFMGSEFQIPQNKIVYVESQRNKLMITTEQGIYSTYLSLSKLNQMLDENRFYRFNHHIILNFDHVVQLEKDYVVMSNGDKIIYTRNAKKQFLKWYVQYKEEYLWN